MDTQTLVIAIAGAITIYFVYFKIINPQAEATIQQAIEHHIMKPQETI